MSVTAVTAATTLLTILAVSALVPTRLVPTRLAPSKLRARERLKGKDRRRGHRQHDEGDPAGSGAICFNCMFLRLPGP